MILRGKRRRERIGGEHREDNRKEKKKERKGERDSERGGSKKQEGVGARGEERIKRGN